MVGGANCSFKRLCQNKSFAELRLVFYEDVFSTFVNKDLFELTDGAALKPQLLLRPLQEDLRLPLQPPDVLLPAVVRVRGGVVGVVARVLAVVIDEAVVVFLALVVSGGLGGGGAAGASCREVKTPHEHRINHSGYGAGLLPDCRWSD